MRFLAFVSCVPVPAFPLCRHLGGLVLLNQEVAFVFFSKYSCMTGDLDVEVVSSLSQVRP